MDVSKNRGTPKWIFGSTQIEPHSKTISETETFFYTYTIWCGDFFCCWNLQHIDFPVQGAILFSVLGSPGCFRYLGLKWYTVHCSHDVSTPILLARYETLRGETPKHISMISWRYPPGCASSRIGYINVYHLHLFSWNKKGCLATPGTSFKPCIATPHLTGVTKRVLVFCCSTGSGQ